MNICRHCHHIVIHSHYLGVVINLEPTELTDVDEARAIAAGIPTYNLWPVKQPRRRHLAEILYRDVAPRHALHTCGETFGSQPRQPSSTHKPPTITDDPPYPF